MMERSDTNEMNEVTKSRKIFGSVVLLFLVLLLLVNLIPSKGIAPLLNDFVNADSLVIEIKHKTITLKAPDALDSIFQQLRLLKEVENVNLQMHTQLDHLYFYKEKKSFEFLVSHTIHHGVVFTAGGRNYKGSNLLGIIEGLTK